MHDYKLSLQYVIQTSKAPVWHKLLRSLLSWEIQQKEALRVWTKDNEVMFSH